MFQLSPWELQDLTGAPVADLAVDEDDKKRELQRAISLVRLRAPTPDTTLDVSVAVYFDLPHERKLRPVRRLLSHPRRDCRLERRDR